MKEVRNSAAALKLFEPVKGQYRSRARAQSMNCLRGNRIIFLAVVLVTSLLTGCLGEVESAPELSDSSAMHRIKVTMGDDMKFVPDRLKVKPGVNVRLELANKGILIHDFVLPDLEQPIEVKLSGGEKGVASFTAPTTPGEYTYVCTQPGHEQAGMKGVMRVTS